MECAATGARAFSQFTIKFPAYGPKRDFIESISLTAPHAAKGSTIIADNDQLASRVMVNTIECGREHVLEPHLRLKMQILENWSAMVPVDLDVESMSIQMVLNHVIGTKPCNMGDAMHFIPFFFRGPFEILLCCVWSEFCILCDSICKRRSAD